MKRAVFFVAMVIAVLFCSCSTDIDNATDEVTEASWNYSSSSPVYEVGSAITSLTISGLTSGTNKIYLVKLNPGSSSIYASNSGYISATTGVSTSSSSSASTSLAQVEANLASGTLVSSNSTSSTPIVNFIPPQQLNPLDVAEELTGSRTITKNSSSDSMSSSRSVSSVSASTTTTTTANTEYSVGSTKKIYVDQDSNLSSFDQEDATLRAVGEHCYVWVVDDYYASSASGDCVDSTIAQEYADLFDEMYPMITNVFGYESDEMLNYANGSISTTDMSACDTGTMVNIVIYDIAKDYSASSGSTSGIVGYFYCKDYYTSDTTLSSSSGYSVINYSNKGKYFYVDSYYANAYLNVTYSTLAHEFQHMINFGMKDITYSLSPSTWYNEMLSMLCEDMMQDKLGIDDDDSPKYRLATFNQYYYISGVSEYLSSSTSYALISYSTAYAFGAWLCRWYGGANLVNKIMTNSSADTTSIASAVSSVTGTTMTFTQILEEYMKSLIFQDTTLAQPTFNQDASSGTFYTAVTYTDSSSTYSYPMTAINLWDSDYSWASSSSSNPGGTGSGNTPGSHSTSSSSSTSTTVTGPALLSCGSSGRTTIRPTGFTLHTVGTASSDTVTITISPASSSTEEMFIMVE